jgi:hypothetical protein
MLRLCFAKPLILGINNFNKHLSTHTQKHSPLGIYEKSHHPTLRSHNCNVPEEVQIHMIREIEVVSFLSS